MTVDTWVGVAGAILMAVGVLLKWKARGRRTRALLPWLVLAGWMLAGQFLIAPLIHGKWLGYVLLGVMVAGIFGVAIVGGRRRHSSGKLPDGTSPSRNARNVGASGSSDSSSTSNHVTDGSDERR